MLLQLCIALQRSDVFGCDKARRTKGVASDPGLILARLIFVFAD